MRSRDDDNELAMIELASRTPIAIGQLRQIFEHPSDPHLLIKVVRADAIAARWGGARRWYKRIPRALHYTGYVRELKEYIAIQARAPRSNPPIALMVGIVHTDLGLGLISEKVRDEAGAAGPTLAKLYELNRGFTPWMEQALAVFLRDLQASNVIVGDLHAWNLVYGSDSRGGPRLVLVDGFGEKNIIPANSISRAFNRWNNGRLYRRMRQQLIDLVRLPSAPTTPV
jgi:hypothetical protein